MPTAAGTQRIWRARVKNALRSYSAAPSFQGPGDVVEPQLLGLQVYRPLHLDDRHLLVEDPGELGWNNCLGLDDALLQSTSHQPPDRLPQARTHSCPHALTQHTCCEQRACQPSLPYHIEQLTGFDTISSMCLNNLSTCRDSFGHLAVCEAPELGEQRLHIVLRLLRL